MPNIQNQTRINIWKAQKYPPEQRERNRIPPWRGPGKSMRYACAYKSRRKPERSWDREASSKVIRSHRASVNETPLQLYVPGPDGMLQS